MKNLHSTDCKQELRRLPSVFEPSKHKGENKLDNHVVLFSNRYPSRSLPQLRMAMGGANELTSALAKLDQKWELTNRSSKRPTGGKAGWTKLVLDPLYDSEDEIETGDDEPMGQDTADPYGAFGTGLGNSQEEFVYLLEPPSTPSMLILFLGGAGLGQFPHIAYGELLSRISKRLNAAIITAPYPLGLDHFDLSKKSGEALRRAAVQCEEKGGYSPYLPKFYLGHSLGSKLLSIQFAASGIRDAEGIGFMSYNNFGFKDTISMVKDFADEMEVGGGRPGDQTLDQILNFAGEAVGMIGLEFSPDPATMDRIVEMKFDENLQKKTRLFIFDEDNLDSSDSFLEACSSTSTSSRGGPSISRLKGKHLSPVYVKLGIDDLNIEDEVKPFVNEISGGFQSASFGDEETMDGAVDSICDWILGKEPMLLAGEVSGESTSINDEDA